jgi:hypothetical protein
MHNIFAVFALAAAGVLATNLLQIRFHDADQDDYPEYEHDELMRQGSSRLENGLTFVIFGGAFIIFTLLFFTSSRESGQTDRKPDAAQYEWVQRGRPGRPVESDRKDRSGARFDAASRHNPAYKEAGEIVHPLLGAPARVDEQVRAARARKERTGQMGVSRSTLRLEAARKTLGTLDGVRNVYYRDISTPTVVLGVVDIPDDPMELALQACWAMNEHDVKGGVVHVVDDILYRQGEWRHWATLWCP